MVESPWLGGTFNFLDELALRQLSSSKNVETAQNPQCFGYVSFLMVGHPFIINHFE